MPAELKDASIAMHAIMEKIDSRRDLCSAIMFCVAIMTLCLLAVTDQGLQVLPIGERVGIAMLVKHNQWLTLSAILISPALALASYVTLEHLLVKSVVLECNALADSDPYHRRAMNLLGDHHQFEVHYLEKAWN